MWSSLRDPVGPMKSVGWPKFLREPAVGKSEKHAAKSKQTNISGVRGKVSDRPRARNGSERKAWVGSARFSSDATTALCEVVCLTYRGVRRYEHVPLQSGAELGHAISVRVGVSELLWVLRGRMAGLGHVSVHDVAHRHQRRVLVPRPARVVAVIHNRVYSPKPRAQASATVSEKEEEKEASSGAPSSQHEWMASSVESLFSRACVCGWRGDYR